MEPRVRGNAKNRQGDACQPERERRVVRRAACRFEFAAQLVELGLRGLESLGMVASIAVFMRVREPVKLCRDGLIFACLFLGPF